MKKSTLIIILVIIVIALGVYAIMKKNAAMNAMTTGGTNTMDNSVPSDNMQNTPMQPANNNNSDSGSTAPAPTSDNSSTSSLGASASITTAAPISVAIQNYAFGPASITVAKGTKVTWTNDDSVAHTVTSDSGSTLNSGSIAPGASFSYMFTTPGTYTYHCAIHPMMKATVTVQ